MSVLLIVDTQHHPQAASQRTTLPIRCRLFEPGRDDWNRGLRELRTTIVHEGRLGRLADGSIRLNGILGVDLRLDADEAARICREGLKITSSALEIDVGAEAFAKALASLPPSGTVLPFARRLSSSRSR